jgi:hypothetical protein
MKPAIEESEFGGPRLMFSRPGGRYPAWTLVVEPSMHGDSAMWVSWSGAGITPTKGGPGYYPVPDWFLAAWQAGEPWQPLVDWLLETYPDRLGRLADVLAEAEVPA